MGFKPNHLPRLIRFGVHYLHHKSSSLTSESTLYLTCPLMCAGSEKLFTHPDSNRTSRFARALHPITPMWICRFTGLIPEDTWSLQRQKCYPNQQSMDCNQLQLVGDANTARNAATYQKKKKKKIKSWSTTYGVIDSITCLVAGVGNAQPRPLGYEPSELTSALPRNVNSVARV